MKKSTVSVFLIAFLLCVLLIPAAFAETALVTDDSGVLTASQLEEQNRNAQRISDTYECSAAILYIPTTGGRNIADFADDYFDHNGIGYGSTNDGTLMVIATEDREVYITTAGTAIDALTDYGIGYILDRVVEPLKQNDYGRAGNIFLTYVTDFYNHYAENGSGYDTNDTVPASHLLLSVFGNCGIGLILAGLPIRKYKKSMNSVASKSNAADYVIGRGLALTQKNDRFVNRHVSRIPIPRVESSSGGHSSGGGSTVHFSSSGISHGGGGSHF